MNSYQVIVTWEWMNVQGRSSRERKLEDNVYNVTIGQLLVAFYA